MTSLLVFLVFLDIFINDQPNLNTLIRATKHTHKNTHTWIEIIPIITSGFDPDFDFLEWELPTCILDWETQPIEKGRSTNLSTIFLITSYNKITIAG